LHWDQNHRAQRPLVQGLIARRGAMALVLISFTAALIVVAFYPWTAMLTASLLVLSVVAYNLIHKRWFWPALVLMGSCRALVFLTAASLLLPPLSGGWWIVAAVAAITGLYTVGISLIARHETIAWPGSGRTLAIALMVLPLTALFWIDAGHGEPVWTLAAALVMVIGLGRVIWLSWQPQPDTMAVVHGLLAGFCLLDGWWMALAGWPAGVVLAWGCFGLTVAAHRYIAGT